MQTDITSKEKVKEKSEQLEEVDEPMRKSKNKSEKLEEIKKQHKSKIENLKKELEDKEKEAKENYEKWLLLNAEFDNFKKRMQREKTDYLKYAGEKIIRDILPIMDNLERAIKTTKENDKAVDLCKGIEMIMSQMKNALESNGAKRFDSLGQVFDPSKHDAISKIITSKHKHNTIIEELQKGYMFHDRLLSPAMVVVAENDKDKKEEKKEPENEKKEDKKNVKNEKMVK